MAQWIVLLRGINVGGRNKLKMAELREALGVKGFTDVKTYIQSGNIVMSSDLSGDAITSAVADLLKSDFDIDAQVFSLGRDELDRMVGDCPFEGDLSRILLYFCIEKLVDFDPNRLVGLSKENEELLITEDVIYLHAPDGISVSKVAEKIDSLTPVGLTARNLRTAHKLLDLASAS